MDLKKINPNLQNALSEAGLTTANELQEMTFSTVKSGADCVIISPNGSGKTTTVALNVIQRLSKPEGESTRALILVETKEKMLEMVAVFQRLNRRNELRVYGTNDKMDIDEDKNQISLGIDVLIGTPLKINSLFSGAGFNLNTVRMFVVDDADLIFKNRHDTVLMRLWESIVRSQLIFTASEITEKLEITAEKLMDEPLWFEPEEDEDTI